MLLFFNSKVWTVMSELLTSFFFIKCLTGLNVLISCFSSSFSGVLLHDASLSLAHHLSLFLLLHGGLTLPIPHAVPGLAGRTAPTEPVPYHGGVVLRSAREGERDGRMKRLSPVGGGKWVSCVTTDGRMTTLSLPSPTRQANDSDMGGAFSETQM